MYTFGDDTKALHQGALVYELGAPMGLIELELDAMRQFSGEDYLQFSAIPNIEEGKPVAIRDLCAAIRNSSANKQAAYSLLKILLSDVVQRAHVVTIPVLNSAVGIQLDELQQQNEITQEQRDAYEAYFTDVQPYTYYSSKLWEIFFQYFTPYWEGDATFESCYDKLYSALELYLYE